MTQNLWTRAYFMQNFMELDIKNISYPKALTFEVWCLKTSLGQFGPKALCNGFIKSLDDEITKTLLTLGPGAKKLHLGHLGREDRSIRKCRTLAPIFAIKTSFSPDSWGKSSKIMKRQKIYWPWGLGPWAHKTYPIIRPEPWLQYSQTTPHFFNEKS